VVPIVTFPKLTEEGVASAEADPPPPGGPPVAVLLVTPTHALVPSALATTRTRRTNWMDDIRPHVEDNAITGLCPPPGMWRSLMTHLDCQAMRTCRATGQEYTRGTGVRACPQRNSIFCSTQGGKRPCPLNLRIPAYLGWSGRLRRVQPAPTEAPPTPRLRTRFPRWMGRPP